MAYESRLYRYRTASAGPLAEAVASEPALQAGAVYRFVLGRDAEPQRLDPHSFAPAPADPFWRHVLVPGHRPVTLTTLLDVLAPHFDTRRSFVVGDGGQIPFGSVAEPVARELRLIVAWSQGHGEPAVMASTAPRLADEAVFLQVIAWDETAGAYQFYDRRAGAWSWVGSSWEALSDDTRGKGPFDSHVNGALNMKELKAPWLHWHSMAAEIRDDVMAPGDPILNHALWRERRQGNEFEVTIARPGIERWTRRRLAASLTAGRLDRLGRWLRQILTTTTANIASSSQESRGLRPGVRVRLPLGFFVNRDALFDLLGIEPDIDVPTVDGGVYRALIELSGLHLSDGQHRFAGDTHFAFAIPEPAYEDTQVLRVLLEAGLISARFAAALLMVDFRNPMFSARRAALVRYCPDIAQEGAADGLERAFVAAIETASAAADQGSPEAELMANLALPETAWRQEYARRIEAFAAIWSWPDAASFAPIAALADLRRREFRRHPLAEFKLTLPYSVTPQEAPFLEFAPDGSVRNKT